MPSFLVHTSIAVAVVAVSKVFWPAKLGMIASTIVFASAIFYSILANVVFNCYVYPEISPLRHIPLVHQPPLSETFFSDGRLPWFSRRVPNKGLLRGYGLLHDEYLVATTIDTVKELLVDRAYDWVKPAAQMELLKMIIGNGLVSLEGEPHRRARKLLQPSFTSQHVHDLYPLFWEKARCLVDALQGKISAKHSHIVNIHDWIGRATLDVIGTAGLGLEFNAIETPDSPIATSYRARYGERPSGATRLFLRFVPIWFAKKFPTKRLKEVLTTNATIKSHLRVILEEKRVLLKRKALNDRDIFSVMIGAGSMDDVELIDHATTLIAAGQDTTAFVLSCLLFEVSQRPELQRKIRLEIEAEIDLSLDVAPTPAQIKKLPLLEAVILETLRLYPAIDCTPRVCLKTNTPTLIAGEKIPKGMTIIIPLRDISRLKENWTNSPYDPEAWCPERWLNYDKRPGTTVTVTDGGATDSWSFMAFSRGAKNCIGEKFARAEMALLLIKLLSHFELKLCGEGGVGQPAGSLDVFYTFTGAISRGVWVSLEKVGA
jgi:cytochrome P450